MRKHVLGADHRTGKQRREEGKIECVGKEVAASFDLAAIYVDYIADRSEGKERDAGRKNDVERVEMSMGEVTYRFVKQIEILEIDKHAYVHHHIERHNHLLGPSLGAPLHENAEQIVADTDSKQDKAVFGR